jgi:tetratricopeptide (TPR) repeat protein
MTARIEKTVFISYRRTNVPWALAIYQNLTMHGYDVFFDYQSIDSGNFEKVIIENIKTRAHFIVILTPSALEECNKPGDWLRREIETAMDEKRNIVPIMLESFDFGSPLVIQALTGKLSALNNYNGLRVYSEYFFEAMDKLRNRYMNIEVYETTTPSLNAEAKEITNNQKTAASEAPPVEKEQLTAQEWTERGYIFFEADNFDEAIRCYIEAIRLDSEFYFPYFSRGFIFLQTGDWGSAIQDFNKAIHLKPDDADVYFNRGFARYNKGDLDGAIQDYDKSIRLEPNDAFSYENRGKAHFIKGDYLTALSDFQKASEMEPEDGSIRLLLVRALRLLGRIEEADELEKIARELIQKEIEYNQACFEAICGNSDKALMFLKIGLENNQVSKDWARQDPDFENIRDDPRFKELVGE